MCGTAATTWVATAVRAAALVAACVEPKASPTPDTTSTPLVAPATAIRQDLVNRLFIPCSSVSDDLTLSGDSLSRRDPDVTPAQVPNGQQEIGPLLDRRTDPTVWYVTV
jgi:hypothetical protein